MAALMATHRGMQGLGGAWRWVQQQRAAGAFKGGVIGPLGLEIKVKRGPHAERLAQNLEQVRRLSVFVGFSTGHHSKRSCVRAALGGKQGSK